MPAFFYFLIFFFGAIIGSFINVLVLRYNTGRSIATGRSQCFNCGKKLNWYELIPILSFIFQKGRCRKCKSKISWQYPIVETVTGLLFLSLATYLPIDVKLFYFFAIFSVLISIAVYDYHHQIIPDLFVWIFNGLALVSLFFGFNYYKLLAGFVLFLFFTFVWFIGRGKWMGFGDAKLALGIGWMLGPVFGIMAIIFSFWIGAVVGIFLMFVIKKRYNMKSGIAFGPFMILGTIIAFFWGEVLFNLFIGF